jgi:hypothetical protein
MFKMMLAVRPALGTAHEVAVARSRHAGYVRQQLRQAPAERNSGGTHDLSTAKLGDLAQLPPTMQRDLAHPGTDFMTAPHPPLPQLIKNGNDVITNLRLVSVVASGDALAQTLFDFGDELVASSWWTTVGADYGLGSATASLHLTGPGISSPRT